VHLDLQNEFSVRPLWNVTARIPGSERPDQEVIVGAHHDSWTYGSVDNLSGTENLLQIGRALSTLLKQGWRPKRTITLATWDGEEYGLFGTAATPALDRFIIDASKEVRWPGTDGTLYEAWKAQNDGQTPIERIGGGSDFQAFFERYGVPAMDLGSSTPGFRGQLPLRLRRLLLAVPLRGPGLRVQRDRLGSVVVDVTRTIEQAKAWQQAAQALQTRANDALRQGDTALFKELNNRIMQTERDLLTQDGLPDRPGTGTSSTLRASTPDTPLNDCPRSTTRCSPMRIGRRPRRTRPASTKACAPPPEP
jgi:N-acetylated-alpha-linked acidic dipeptidase